MTRRLAAAVLAGAAAVSLTAGCTGGAASSPTATALPSTPVGEVQAALADSANDRTVDFSGTLSSPAGSGTVAGQAQFGSNDAVSVTQTVEGASVGAVLIGRTLYLNLPQLADELNGRPWGRLDLSSAGANPTGPADGIFGALLSVAQNADPRTEFDELLASGDLARTGTETVDGVRAAHYRGKIIQDSDLGGAEALKYLTGSEIDLLQNLAQDEGMTGATVDVWVGPDGLPVRSELGIASIQGDIFMQLDYTHWGTAAGVSAPPDGEVTGIDQLLSTASPSPVSIP
jgi:hypothetical protein